MNLHQKGVYEAQWEEMRRIFRRLDSASMPFLTAFVLMFALSHLAKSYAPSLLPIVKEMTQGAGFLLVFIPCGAWMLFAHLKAMNFRCPRCRNVFVTGREIYRVSSNEEYKCPHCGLMKGEKFFIE